MRWREAGTAGRGDFLKLLHFLFFFPPGLPTRGFLGHWWKLSELKRWLTLDIICRWIGEFAPVFWERGGNPVNTQILSVRWQLSCHFHSWVETGFDQGLLCYLLPCSTVGGFTLTRVGYFKQPSCGITQIYKVVSVNGHSPWRCFKK